jgi:hypothetical protein
VHMNVVFRDDTFQNAHVLGITNLNQQVPTSLFDVTLQNVVTVFRYPNYMRSQSTSGMGAFSVFLHFPLLSTRV